MKALAESKLNAHYRDLIKAIYYFAPEGWVDLTSYGMTFAEFSRESMLAEYSPWLDVSMLSDKEVDWHLHFLDGFPAREPPPPKQMSLFQEAI